MSLLALQNRTRETFQRMLDDPNTPEQNRELAVKAIAAIERSIARFAPPTPPIESPND